MSKRKKKSTSRPSVINMTELQLKAAPMAKPTFRTGKYMTEKDRPRDKSYKKYINDDNF